MWNAIKTEDADITAAIAKSELRSVVVFSGAHPAHRRMLEGYCTAEIKMLGDWTAGRYASGKQKLRAYVSTALALRSSTFDAMVIEGTTPTILMAPIINFIRHRPKRIIALCMDDALYRTFIMDGGILKRILTRWSFNHVSGIICNSAMVARLARENLRPLPIEIRYPQVSEVRVGTLAVVEPSLESHNIVLIGSGSEYCKGVDIAVKALDILRDQFSDVQLTILGFPEIKEAKHPGVHSPGPVDDIAPYLAEASVLIHPGRGEAFGIVVIEAMLAGIVPFVSEWTGAAEVASKASPDLVVPLQVEEFAKRIASLWYANSEQRKRLSTDIRQIARNFIIDSKSQPSIKSFIGYT